MPSYDFKPLSPEEFENLVRDLLQEELGVTLEGFAAGRDGGIDLRHSRDPAKSLIVQCKHYCDSEFSTLLSQLKRKEVPKVRALNPARYVLATSMRLTPGNKADIATAFAGYIRTPQDVFGADDLNNLIGRFPEVEKRHFKLYLSSIVVLDGVLHSDLYNRAGALVDAMARTAHIYVPNVSFWRAQEVLEQRKVCIIAGVPGIGKTTLAQMLLLDLHRRKYEVFSVSSDIVEAERVYRADRPQAFYYDDFLGQVAENDKLGKNEDDRLTQFIAQVARSENKRLILTTREYILAQARLRYEKLDRHPIDVHKYVLALSDYSRIDRARILYNHVYFSTLPPASKQALVNQRAYLAVVDHANYNPRLIENIVRLAAESASTPGEFSRFMMSILDNPVQLWGHPFERQISEFDRRLLLILATLPTEIDLEDLRGIATGSLRGADPPSKAARDFLDSLRVLERTFIEVRRGNEKHGTRVMVVSLHNPSIRDFLLSYLDRNPEEVQALLEHASCHEQCRSLWNFAQQPTRKASGVTTRYEGLQRSLERFAPWMYSALQRTFWSSPVEIDTVTWDDGFQEKRKKAVSYERRLMLLGEVALRLRVPEDEPWTKGTLDRIVLRWMDGNGDKEALPEVLDYVSESLIWSVQELDDIADVAREWLVSSLHETDDFRALMAIRQAIPGFLDDAALSRARPAYERWRSERQEYVLEYATDGDEVDDVMRDLSNVAEFFSDSLSPVFEQRADARRADLPERYFPPSEPPLPRAEQLSLDPVAELMAIESMFQTLNDDL